MPQSHTHYGYGGLLGINTQSSTEICALGLFCRGVYETELPIDT